LIETLNRSGVPVLAADVPSGVLIDTGSACGVAVRARLTVTMIADKFGLRTGAAVDHAGQVLVAALDLPASLYEGVPGSPPGSGPNRARSGCRRAGLRRTRVISATCWWSVGRPAIPVPQG
jgi:ADP-dependent NAD(P)H-hydrate dehydratase / NAD(P)H-hydrate epimerase